MQDIKRRYLYPVHSEGSFFGLLEEFVSKTNQGSPDSLEEIHSHEAGEHRARDTQSTRTGDQWDLNYD